jgi:hypothetical protein
MYNFWRSGHKMETYRSSPFISRRERRFAHMRNELNPQSPYCAKLLDSKLKTVLMFGTCK